MELGHQFAHPQEEMPKGWWICLPSQLQEARDALQGFVLLNLGR